MVEPQVSKVAIELETLYFASMKKCNMCTEIKSDEEFATRKRNDAVVLQSNCRECQKIYRKLHYEKNRQKYIDKAAKWKTEQKIEFITWLKTKSCVDCGVSDFRVLEFDHLRDKVIGISKLFGQSKLSSMQEELDKCEIVCANCHKIRTATRGNFYNYE